MFDSQHIQESLGKMQNFHTKDKNIQLKVGSTKDDRNMFPELPMLLRSTLHLHFKNISLKSFSHSSGHFFL